MKIADNVPIRLCSSRAWRTYLGGRLLDQLYGKAEEEDGHFPEEWIASMVEARNVGRDEVREEGMSHLASDPSRTLKAVIEENPARYLGRKRVDQSGITMGVLVKLIDAAERLTIQVHPDRKMARELFGSEYGKTECWHILGGRELDGEKPCVYLGFRPGVTRKQWKCCFEEQDLEGMKRCLHRFDVVPGDTILIEGGVPHAIGAGCFLAEIQEPTDYTIRVEKTTPSGYRVEDAMCHQGLGFERMFDCFHYAPLSKEEAHKRWFKNGKEERSSEEGTINCLIGYSDTPFFQMNELVIQKRMTVPQRDECSSLYVLEGQGVMRSGAGEEAVSAGDQFFIPAGTGELVWEPLSGKMLRMIQCYGPEIKISCNDYSTML